MFYPKFRKDVKYRIGPQYVYFTNCDGKRVTIDKKYKDNIVGADGKHSTKLSSDTIDRLISLKIFKMNRIRKRGVNTDILLWRFPKDLSAVRPLARVINILLPVFSIIMPVVGIHAVINNPDIYDGEINWLLYMLVVFISTMLHEFGHFFAAVANKLRVYSLVINLFLCFFKGGCIEAEDRKLPIIQDVQFSMAGVEVNAILAGLFLYIACNGGGINAYLAGFLNVILVLINLLPIDGLDGGYILARLLDADSVSSWIRRVFSGRAANNTSYSSRSVQHRLSTAFAFASYLLFLAINGILFYFFVF